MDYLATVPNVLFLGQAVACAGTAMSNTLKDVPDHLKVELPVDEEMQMGMTNGLALEGHLPVSIFPRWNFLVCAANQLVNHLDKFPLITEGQITPSIIIRTSVGSERPLFPGYQHIGNMSDDEVKSLFN